MINILIEIRTPEPLAGECIGPCCSGWRRPPGGDGGCVRRWVFTEVSHLQNDAQAAPTAWIWAGMHSGMVYEGIGTTWDHLGSSLARSTFGRHPLQELRTAAGTVFTRLWSCETHLQLHPLLSLGVAMDRAH